MKLIVPEHGSGEVISVWRDADRVVSSRLLYPEARAAMGRATRTRRLDKDAAQGARTLVERLWRDVDRVDVSEDLARSAGDLAETHALRAYDAVHLASALSIADAVLVAADDELIGAARALGLATIGALG